jgi:hypothetical protein
MNKIGLAVLRLACCWSDAGVLLRGRSPAAVRFVADSPLEGNGFELPVPRCLAIANSVGAFIRR